jgi:hypothetical protein
MASILFLISILVLATTEGCKPKVRQNPPQIIGERTNQQGAVTQRIILESSYSEESVLLTPEGPRMRMHGQVAYFLEEPGKPRQELPIMSSVAIAAAYSFSNCLPVEGTNLWIAAGIDPSGNGDNLRFVLFDEKHIIRAKVMKAVPEWKSEKPVNEFQDGNHIMMIRSPDGPEKYEVLADKTAKINE